MSLLQVLLSRTRRCAGQEDLLFCFGSRPAGARARGKHFSRAQSQVCPKSANQIFGLLRIGDYCEDSRPPRTLTHAPHALLAHKPHHICYLGAHISPNLDRRKGFADTGIEVIQRFPKGRQIALHESR